MKIYDPNFTYFKKILEDGRIVTVIPLITGTARITVTTDPLFYDNGW